MHSSSIGNYGEQISRILDTGTYYIRIDQGVIQAQANYQLSLSLSSDMGTVSICSTVDSESSSAVNTNGHSWISYDAWSSYNQGAGEYKSNSNETTFGTWGNSPTGKGNGLFENLEKNRQIAFQVKREASLDIQQEKNLFSQVEIFKKQGDGAWKYTFPCSGFASSIWRTLTGEDFTYINSLGLVVTPANLNEAIYIKNGKSTTGYKFL